MVFGNVTNKTDGDEIYTGVVTAVRGSVVDVHFPAGMPPIHNMLTTGSAEDIIIEIGRAHV